MQRRQQLGREEVTLKEKLAEHYAKRDFQAKKQSASTVGVSFSVGMMVTLAIEGLTVLIPSYYVDRSTGQYTSFFYIAECIVIWLFLEAVGNWWLTYYDVLNRVTKETKDLHFPGHANTPPGWKNCVTCMLDAPPRSHHCTLCNHCILKRDHHCFFTGSCVGYHNQRHFFIFCIYIVLASGSAAFMQISYLTAQFPLFTKEAVFYIPVVAIWQMITGATSFANVFILIHLYLTIFCFGAGLFFLGWETLVIWRGQTSYEAWKQIMVYRQSSVFSNFYSVFGNPLNIMLCILVPVRITSPGDGVKWAIQPKSEKGH
ncbi:probable palmitoyltransferase ZDHHC24 [Aplysia californica]|uniref:Palmitoyltransferase n=1 Tax=Aplysia californica TaxID=6500 RepID=A0ABM0K182_APLCA|nr:probable palmitoyltransferase ZDHHC24 [Aplysia californica]